MTHLTGSSPAVVRINLVDDRGTPIGNLEVAVDPHGADFRPTGELPSCTNEKFSITIPPALAVTLALSSCLLCGLQAQMQ